MHTGTSYRFGCYMDWKQAARTCGAVRTLVARAMLREPENEARLDRLVTTVKRAMGETAYDELEAVGRQFGYEDALAGAHVAAGSCPRVNALPVIVALVTGAAPLARRAYIVSR